MSDVTLRSAGVPVTFDGMGVDIGAVEGIAGAGSGFGFDLGVGVRTDPEVLVGGSVHEISVPSTGTAKTPRAHQQSRQLHVRGLFGGDVFGEEAQTASFNIGSVTDSLVGAVEFETSAAAFRTGLPTTVQATGRLCRRKV